MVDAFIIAASRATRANIETGGYLGGKLVSKLLDRRAADDSIVVDVCAHAWEGVNAGGRSVARGHRSHSYTEGYIGLGESYVRFMM